MNGRMDDSPCRQDEVDSTPLQVRGDLVAIPAKNTDL